MKQFSKVVIKKQYGEEVAELRHLYHFDFVGTIAMQIIEKHAVIAAEPDGEDNSGRQKGKLMLPMDVVNRAFDLAESMVLAAEARGHLLSIPEPTIMEEN